MNINQSKETLMNRWITQMQRVENQMFIWVNQHNKRPSLDYLLQKITHLAGARISIASLVSLYFLTSGQWNTMVLEAIIALTISHIPVAIVKKFYPRLRPYLVLPLTRTCKKPL